MKIWLASYPRSGNTYFRILVHHYTGWPTYSWKPEKIIPEGSVVGRAHQMTAYTPGEPTTDPNIAGFMKTHEYHNDGHPALLLLRDGRDAIVSYAKYCKTFFPEQHKDFTEENLITSFIKGWSGYGPWGKYARSWMDRSPPAIVLPFENLIGSSPLEVLKATLAKLNIPEPEWVTTEDPPNFKTLNKINPKFFRSGKNGDGKRQMKPYQEHLFRQEQLVPYNLEDEPWKME